VAEGDDVTTDQRGEVWAIVRDAVAAGERVGTIGPALGYEQRSAKLDALAREYADKVEAVLSTKGDV
jgi:hypothetical protein